MIYKMKNIGLDTTNNSYKPDIEMVKQFNYIHTNISSNNDYLFRELLEMDDFKDTKLVTTIDFLDKLEETLASHIYFIGGKPIDILLIDSKCDINTYKDNIKAVIEKGIVKSVGLSNPDKIDTISKFIKMFKNEFAGISLNLCPLNFNFDIIQWCNKNNVYIFGFNSFGGNISSNLVIESFTVPYLLNFASVYCDIVFLSGRDLIRANEDRVYLGQLVGKEVTDNKIYELRKSVDKLVKPLKRVINMSLVVEKDKIVLPYYTPSDIFNPEELYLSLENKKLKFEPMKEEDKDEIIGLSESFLLSYVLPKDSKSDEDILASIKLKYLGMLSIQYHTNFSWYTKLAKIDNNILVISAVKDRVYKRIFGPNKVVQEANHYILCCYNGKILFRKLQNASLIP